MRRGSSAPVTKRCGGVIEPLLQSAQASSPANRLCEEDEIQPESARAAYPNPLHPPTALPPSASALPSPRPSLPCFTVARTHNTPACQKRESEAEILHEGAGAWNVAWVCAFLTQKY